LYNVRKESSNSEENEKARLDGKTRKDREMKLRMKKQQQRLREEKEIEQIVHFYSR